MTSGLTESTYPYPPTVTSTDSRSHSGSASGAEDEDRRREETTRLTKQALWNPGQGTRIATLPSPGQEPGERGVEMDKSVLELGRPGLSTESLPVHHSGTVGACPPTINTEICREEAVAIPSLEKSAPSQQFSSSELQPSRPAPSPPTCPSNSTSPATQKGTTRKRAVSRTSPNSVFRLLPRETRPALRRMLCFDSKARTTMGQLLWGRSGGGGIIALEEGEKCGCESGQESGVEDAEDDEREDDYQDSDEEYDEDLGDSWIKGIDTCTGEEEPTHVHIRIPADEKTSKKRFF